MATERRRNDSKDRHQPESNFGVARPDQRHPKHRHPILYHRAAGSWPKPLLPPAIELVLGCTHVSLRNWHDMLFSDRLSTRTSPEGERENHRQVRLWS